MHLNSGAFAISLATMMPVYGSCIAPPPPDAPIPEQWKDSLPLAWDNGLIRFQRENPDYSLATYKNFAFDQIMDGNGTINVCVRWGSNKTVTETNRQQIESQYRKIYQYWFEWLPGYDSFPFDKVDINFVGWAVADRNLLQGSTDGLDIYTESKDEYGFLDCNPGCSVDKHLDGDFSDCPGGPKHRYHHFLWFDNTWGDRDMGAAIGYGIDISLWGWENVSSKMGDWPILVHEMGHTIGFLDYLDSGIANGTNSVCDIFFLPPNHPQEFVMKPGDGGAHVSTITEMEGWMIRYWWTRVSRLRGWQSDNTIYPPLPDCPDEDSEIEKRSSHQRCQV